MRSGRLSCSNKSVGANWVFFLKFLPNFSPSKGAVSSIVRLPPRGVPIFVTPENRGVFNWRQGPRIAFGMSYCPGAATESYSSFRNAYA
ncbi:hypothetical protein CPPEL_08295 [Corynebacterium pseudopelargi]|uniref:Uncharacterized protein n=1 Tax=Corynebacterium pseudopelargi TaxID=2080757 RepID=A0A3G6IW22_9CORY|nr:hypothetical protein CPPEL_08295 [Corynebacterium pseudopelargi]